MDFKTITLDISDQIATITLNRPDRLNACSLDMADDIADALDQLGDARCLIITGAGRAFCSGADLQARGDRPVTGGQGSYAALTRRYNPTMMKIARLNIPVITAIIGLIFPPIKSEKVSSVAAMVQSASKFSLLTVPSALTTMIPPGNENLKETPNGPLCEANNLIRSSISLKVMCIFFTNLANYRLISSTDTCKITIFTLV